MIWDSFQTKIKCKRLTLHSLWNLSYVRMHMYTWLECAHTLGFSAVFLFQKEFYYSKNKLYFPKTLPQVNFHDIGP